MPHDTDVSRPDWAREEREKDATTVLMGARRRYVATAFIGLASLVAAFFGYVSFGTTGVISGVVGAAVLNWALTSFARRSTGYQWWLRYALATLDLLLITLVVAAFGNESLAMLYLLVVVLYSFDRGRAVGYYASVVAGVFMIGGTWIYAKVSGQPVRWGWTFAAAAMLVVVSLQAVPIASRLLRRIRYTRQRIQRAESGDLLARADARHSDELGLLQQSFNRMIEQLGRLIGSVKSEADGVASLADRLASTSASLTGSSTEFAGAARALAGSMERQGALTAGGATRTSEALSSSERLHGSVEEMNDRVRALVQTATNSQEAVSRAADTLLAVGERVRDTAVTVSSLGAASERVGDFVDAVARIARQTNLLALNAAIEAARAGEQGKGFGVVAEEVRKLAEESARAAKAIAATIAEVRDNIALAVRSMDESEQQVRGVGDIAGQATAALSSIVGGVSRIAELVADAAALSREQSTAMRQLAEMIVGVQSVSGAATTQARAAADTATTQAQSLETVAATARELAELSERLRASISRFSVDGDDVSAPPTRSLSIPAPSSKA